MGDRDDRYNGSELGRKRKKRYYKRHRDQILAYYRDYYRKRRKTSAEGK